MNLIESFIAIPAAVAQKQAQQINAAANTQGNQLTLAQSLNSQVLPFKKQLNENKDLKAV